MSSLTPYPLQVRGEIDPRLSRWQWLVKWLLAIPHYIILFFLWIAFVVVTVIAFFAILFTGRYPRGLFDFNAGVLRWTWRVDFYSYGVLATDRYPPFTLGDDPTYPATLSIEYPERLSRGLVLVKWWLLAIPHYAIVSVLIGGGGYAAGRVGEGEAWWWSGGLVSLVVLFAAIGLLFTTRYPRGLFDLALGCQRWWLRTVAYAALMTDAYPPFRMDQGGEEPVPEPPPPTSGPGAATAAMAGT